MSKRIAIYSRVSTLEQKDNYSIGEQKEQLEKYCDVKGWQLYNHYSDGGFSGAKLERPAINELIKDAKHKKFDGVLVYKLDRLSRSQKDTLYLIEEVFNANDVAFISLNENLDTDTPFGKAMIGILSVFAQLEREQISERFTMGKIGRAKSGHAMAWSPETRTYGYEIKNDDYKTVPHEAKVVSETFRHYIQTQSINRVVKDWNIQNKGGKKWYYSTVSRILSNPTYYGKIRFKGEEYDGNHQPIIDRETYTLAQDIMKKQRIKHNNTFTGNRPFQAKHMLSGLLYCGKCGHPLTIGMSAKRADGTRNMYYKCWTRVKKYRLMHDIDHACGKEIYQKNDMEETIKNELSQLQLNPDLIDIEDDTFEVDLNHYKNEIKKLENKRDRLLDLYLDNAMDKNQLDNKNVGINEKIAYFEKEMKRLSEKDESDVLKAKESLINSGNIDQLNDEELRKITKMLIKKITVSPHKLAIQWVF